MVKYNRNNESARSEVEIGKTYEGKVTSVVPFGVFVEILPGLEGLCHISELADMRIQNIEEYIKKGETISVKVLDVNERGQIKLSRRALLSKNYKPSPSGGRPSSPRRRQENSAALGDVEVGKVYEGKVTSVVPFGAFVEILPGVEGLCHISEIAETRIQNIDDHVKRGEVIAVKVLDVNERGQIKLSRKAAAQNKAHAYHEDEEE